MKLLSSIFRKNKKICIILCTTPDYNTSCYIAQKLLKKKLAVCISIIPKITSFYLWEKNIEKKHESQILIKTFVQFKKIVFSKIQQHHPYDVPELILLKTDTIEKKYLSWMYNEINL